MDSAIEQRSVRRLVAHATTTGGTPRRHVLEWGLNLKCIRAEVYFNSKTVRTTVATVHHSPGLRDCTDHRDHVAIHDDDDRLSLSLSS